MLSAEEIERYDRHLHLTDVGSAGQERLKSAKVLVIGAGGLGCPVLQYLTAAGVGTIGIIDGDKVDVSNLQRQILFDTSDAGKYKAETAFHKLSLQNPFVNFKVYNTFLTTENALEIISAFDIVIDGTDNFPTRYLINDACIIADKPFVFGSIYKFEGQVSVFNYQGGPSYRCLYPSPPTPTEVPNCSNVGVLGVLPGNIGTLMANECLKMILQIGEVSSGKLMLINLLTNANLSLNVNRLASNFERVELEKEYNFECEVKELKNEMMKTIEAIELKSKLDKGEEVSILDVREIFEFEVCSIEGSVLIPMNTIRSRINEIDEVIPTVVVCHHGMRSARVIDFLEEQGFHNLYNLTGGIHAWAVEVDQNMTRY